MKQKRKIVLYTGIAAVLITAIALLYMQQNKSFLNYNAKQCMESKECSKDAFLRIAFGNEGAVDVSNPLDDRLVKWEKPVSIEIVGRYNEKLLSFVKQHIWMINSISEYPPISIPSPVENINMTVVFTGDIDKDVYETYRKDIVRLFGDDSGANNFFKQYEVIKKMGVLRCFATTGHKSDNTISTAIVFIPNNLIDWQIRGCIEEEITQILGLGNDVPDAKYTKFNDSDITKEMTVLDWFLFKILYHPKMKAGMNKEQVKAVFGDVYDELMGGV